MKTFNASHSRPEQYQFCGYSRWEAFDEHLSCWQKSTWLWLKACIEEGLMEGHRSFKFAKKVVVGKNEIFSKIENTEMENKSVAQGKWKMNTDSFQRAEEVSDEHMLWKSIHSQRLLSCSDKKLGGRRWNKVSKARGVHDSGFQRLKRGTEQWGKEAKTGRMKRFGPWLGFQEIWAKKTKMLFLKCLSFIDWGTL